MLSKLDLRTGVIMLSALVLGLMWAGYNLQLAGGARNDTTLRPLIWVVFGCPFALALGWVLARRHEAALAAFCCFCLYFFTFFVAQRGESLWLSSSEAAASGHQLHFQLVLALHAVGGLGLIFWRTREVSYGTNAA
ncbi:MAG: hypothetical protein EI684_03500 [Candidatus Viridilinea halotolerans]|uniref:Uncharacterized protein n=1 Tax=Candidatus Viridilinea halotolerans TaxID=2491704 RepID=A0A426U7J9_9CHLR|nr:MAG: hypothetical protein EI684_03500 [Candidatus Viridilinea halotolerans]